VSVCAWPLALERLVLGLLVVRPSIPATECCSSPGCGPDLCSSTPAELTLVRLALPLCRSSSMPVLSPPIHVALMPLCPFSPMCVVPMSPLSKVASLLPVVSYSAAPASSSLVCLRFVLCFCLAIPPKLGWQVLDSFPWMALFLCGVHPPSRLPPLGGRAVCVLSTCILWVEAPRSLASRDPSSGLPPPAEQVDGIDKRGNQIFKLYWLDAV
jgi:hypothetical protein